MANTFASFGLEEGQSRRATAKGGTNKPTPTLQQSPLPFAERLGCSPDEACEAMSIGRTLLYELIAEGLIETIKVRKRRIVSVPSLLQLMGLRPKASKTELPTAPGYRGQGILAQQRLGSPAAEPKPRRPGRPRRRPVNGAAT